MKHPLFEAARGLVGVPFRLHGRDPATGLDCVGLIAAALARCGRAVTTPRGYALRSLDPEPWLAFAGANGLAETPSDPDVVLAAVHPLQPHLLVAGAGAFIHAHAGIGRVTAMPAPLPWPVLRQWRLLETKD